MVLSMPAVCAAVSESARICVRVILQTLARVSQVRVAERMGVFKKWITDKKLPCIVRATSRYSDGKGRVWLLADPKVAKLKAAA